MLILQLDVMQKAGRWECSGVSWKVSFSPPAALLDGVATPVCRFSREKRFALRDCLMQLWKHNPYHGFLCADKSHHLPSTSWSSENHGSQWLAEDSRETVRGRPDWHLGHSQTCLQDTPHFRGSAKAALSSPWSRPRRDPEEERSPEDRGKGCVLRAHCVRCTEPHTSLGDGVPGREESPSELSLPRGSAREAEAERESRAMKAMSLSQPASARASTSFPRQERGPTGMTLEESASGDPQSLPVLSQPRLQQPPREGLCVPCCSLPLSSVKTEAPPRS
ncbi:uncharacterized protein LOC115288520 isoform X2 [Suricata suricatta]|uniref:uncharacterized protein LOC115288520 isoform X2 n=1 Tax=Suricata suricatta TaxID=37032 RepID=UPI0011554530|nr:uncharacterized protein LOC115288520 isoform X2 [Suricata suricatta]